jgi:hypothetical protein
MDEEVVHRFDILAEKAHCFSFLLFLLVHEAAHRWLRARHPEASGCPSNAWRRGQVPISGRAILFLGPGTAIRARPAEDCGRAATARPNMSRHDPAANLPAVSGLWWLFSQADRAAVHNGFIKNG